MPEDRDYEEILGGTVDEAKDAIAELDDPDYEAIIEAEAKGDGRKTLISHLEEQLEQQSFEAGEEEAKSGLFLAGLSPVQTLAGGLIIGLLVGLVVASSGFFSVELVGGDQASPSEIQDDVRELVTAGGFNGTVDVSQPVVQNRMYFVNITMTQEAQNQSVTQSQLAYVTLDGQLLFPVQQRLGQTISPIPLQQGQGNSTA